MLRLGLALLLLLGARSRPLPKVVPATEPGPIAVAALQVLSGPVDRLSAGQEWKPVRSGARLATGEKVRVGAGGLLSVDFPWMRITAGPRTTLGVSAGRLLATFLESGRLEQEAEAGIIKLRTPEALVRGEGRLVVRRESGVTAVAAVRGTFRVEAAAVTVVLHQGEGTLVVAGNPPDTPTPLPRAPRVVFPGGDPIYALKGTPISLSWTPSGPANHVQVFGLEPGDLLIARDVTTPPVKVDLPYPGTYRWRVNARTDQGLEGVPSPEGFFCVTDK
jgi:hypothetical protein